MREQKFILTCDICKKLIKESDSKIEEISRNFQVICSEDRKVHKLGKDSNTSGVGRRIKEAREKLGFNQARLATEAEITPAAISQIEAGDRTPSTPILRRLATALQVSTDYLLGSSDKSELKDMLQDQSVQKFFRGFQDLNGTDKQFIQKQIDLLRSQSKSKK
jgi:transcriptional regulator with XRE-family HTH domain